MISMFSSSPRLIGAFIFAILASLAISSPALAASGKDRDRDGLSAKQEKRYKTNPKKADTDSDGLKDGAEVKAHKTNPRKADSDGDGLRDGNEVKKTKSNPRKADTDDDGIRDDREVKGKSDPRKKDSDDDGIDDIHEHGEYGEGREAEGVLAAISESEVSITTEEGSTVIASVDSSTLLRAPDVNGDGAVNLADFKVGDKVEAHFEASEGGNRALSIKLEREDGEDQGDYQDGHGDEPDSDEGDDEERPEGTEVKGRLVAIAEGSVTLSRRDGSQFNLTVTGDTRLKAPDRDRSGNITLADFVVGDKIEARVGADGTTAYELKVD